MQLELHSIDIFIIIAYLAMTIFIGFWVSRLASKNLDSYFFRRQSDAVVYFGHFQRIGYV